MAPKVSIIDCGVANLSSVSNALLNAGAEVEILSTPQKLKDADRIIFPGVGAFAKCMSNFQEAGFKDELLDIVKNKGRPLLGICLGMQVLFTKGHEFGITEGLGWFKGEVKKIESSDPNLRIPHIGWNDLTFYKEHPVFAGLPPHPDFYFVHSFHAVPEEKQDLVATCDYGGSITASVSKENIVAVQFHPEKSQKVGFKLLQNFLRWSP